MSKIIINEYHIAQSQYTPSANCKLSSVLWGNGCWWWLTLVEYSRSPHSFCYQLWSVGWVTHKYRENNFIVLKNQNWNHNCDDHKPCIPQRVITLSIIPTFPDMVWCGRYLAGWGTKDTSRHFARDYSWNQMKHGRFFLEAQNSSR